MLLALVAVLAGVLAGWVSGRRLPLVGRRRQWRAGALLVAGGSLELGAQHWWGGTSGVVLAGAGYGLLALFAVANSRHPGLVLVAVGLVANMSVVLADHGMPVQGGPAAPAAPGYHHGLTSRDHLAALSDVIEVAPLHETASAGDVLVAVGGAIGFFAWLEPRARRRPDPPHPAVGPA